MKYAFMLKVTGKSELFLLADMLRYVTVSSLYQFIINSCKPRYSDWGFEGKRYIYIYSMKFFTRYFLNSIRDFPAE
jgi:hypothetical protein